MKVISNNAILPDILLVDPKLRLMLCISLQWSILNGPL